MKVLHRVLDLLTLAERTTNSHEYQIAATEAVRLIDKHQLRPLVQAGQEAACLTALVEQVHQVKIDAQVKEGDWGYRLHSLVIEGPNQLQAFQALVELFQLFAQGWQRFAVRDHVSDKEGKVRIAFAVGLCEALRQDLCLRDPDEVLRDQEDEQPWGPSSGGAPGADPPGRPSASPKTGGQEAQQPTRATAGTTGTIAMPAPPAASGLPLSTAGTPIEWIAVLAQARRLELQARAYKRGCKFGRHRSFPIRWPLHLLGPAPAPPAAALQPQRRRAALLAAGPRSAAPASPARPGGVGVQHKVPPR